MKNSDNSSETVPAHLGHLSPERRALLALKLKQKAAASGTPTTNHRRRAAGDDGLALRRAVSETQATPLRPVPRTEALPLSFAQQRLWFLDQLEPGSTAYNLPGAFTVSGPLNRAALEACVNEIRSRHEVLRTTFAAEEGRPVQVVAPWRAEALPLADLAALPESVRQDEVRRLIGEDARQPFDLAAGPLVRIRLLRLAEMEHVMLLTMHHIISDAWSTDVLISEAAILYDAFTRGARSPLPALDIQYADYASWQQQRLEGEALDEQLSYWRKQLAGSLPILELPADRPRPAVPSYRGARLARGLPAALAADFKALCRREEVTLFMGGLAAFQALLRRYTGQDDLIVGTPIANRNRREVEGLIGFFLNTLVLRTQLAGAPSFRQLLGRVREVALGAYAHQELPFEMLVEALQPERNLSLQPLFQVLFVLQPATARLNSGDLRWQAVGSEMTTSKFDLTLTLNETDEGLDAVFEYSTDLFDEARIARMLDHLECLLASAVSDPARSILDLELLPAAEKEQVLSGWNQTRRDLEGRLPVHEMFEAQAARTPGQVALIFEGRSLTYDELNGRANRLAHYLRGLGGGADSLVGLCVERGVEMMVGLLGILKSGAAYVPLDPAYPKERLAYMLDDTRAPVLVTQRSCAAQMPVAGAHVLCLDDDWPLIERQSDANPCALADADGLAYVIYTSGSTGRPKGIGLPHRALANLIQWHLATMLGGARTLQFASLSFDASFHEAFSAWASGGTLHVISEEMRRDVEGLAHHIVETGIEKVTLPVVVLQQMAEHFMNREPAPLPFREITTTGEQLQITTPIKRFFERLGPVPLHNHYGPSETHVVTAYTMDHEPEGWPMHPPIGRPIWNTQMYVLDERLQPTAIGVPGELYIGGCSLARGYLNRAELTAEKFVPDPFSAAGGERLYRTGDQARYRGDGEIEYLGRLDSQVKIRGYRVEPGEIESILSTHEAVVEVAVVAREDQPGRKRLVAYLVCDRQPAPPSSELQSLLRERLPDYMVPSAFVMLDHLPLTSNGKVDRRALPPPEQTSQRDDYVAPRTETEAIVAAIWSEVLGVERAGRHDNFFERGGHSLLATQVVSRVRKTFEIPLPLRTLFESATLAEFAAAVEAARQNGNDHDFPPVRPVARTGDLPLSFSQQRLWLMDQLEPGNIFYNLPFALRLSGPLDIRALTRAFGETVNRHESLRTSLRTVNGQPVQHVSAANAYRLPIIDLGELADSTKEDGARRLAIEEANTPFDLARGPLLRARLVRLSEREHVALFTMHHVVTDGWSIGIFIRDLVAFYEAASAGRPSPLAPLAVQYADYAFTQRQWLEGDVLETQLSYWRQQLAGDVGPMRLPLDKPRPKARSYRGAAQAVTINRGQCDALNAISRRQSATLYMTLLAAYDVLLHCYSGQDVITVGSPIANRRRVEVEELIGFFANTLVMRVSVACDPTFQELVARARKVALDAYAHQDLPFERLVEALQPERSLSYTPLFQVEFTLQNVPVQPLDFSGVRLAPLEIGEREVSAQFDLMLDLFEAADGLSGTLRYSKELFFADTVAQMAAQYERIIASVTADPDIKLSALREQFDRAADEHRAANADHLKQRFAEKLKTAKRRTAITLDPATASRP